jgi:dTDP-glucose 4,6-dehydratase
VVGVFNLLEAVKTTGAVEKFVQVSTDEVYGELPIDRPDLNFTEESNFAPNIPYSATKAGGDLLCRAYFNTWQVPVIVTHCTNNYGPYQYPEKLIPFFCVRMLEGKKLPLYGNGKNVRDWIYVLDHCRALELCLISGKAGETYNVGGDNELSNIDIARKILKFFNKDESWLEFVADRPGHDKRYAIDFSKIQKELGWTPTVDFDKMFELTVKWYVDNPVWIEKVRKKTGVFNPHIDLWKPHLKK